MIKFVIPLAGILAAISSPAFAALSVTSSTANWTVINYADPNQADPSKDQQTGSEEGDIVGNATHGSLYTAFDNGGTPGNLTDGEIGFRVRVAGDANPGGLKTVIWVGIDVNSDGKVDLFAGALEDARIGYYPAGNSANTSPNTTSINSSAPYHQVVTSATNFNFSAVTAANDPTAANFNLDQGTGGGGIHNDQFVSFKLAFAPLVTAVNGMNLLGLNTFNENTPLRFIAATSNNANVLNMDLNGVNGGTKSNTSWTDLNGFTKTFTSNGTAIPEPSCLLLISLAGLLLGIRRRN